MSRTLSDATELEELVLLAARKYPGSTGGELVDQIEAAGRGLSHSAAWRVFDRLVAAGFLTSTLRAPLPQRGGRAAKLYEITPIGRALLVRLSAQRARFR